MSMPGRPRKLPAQYDPRAIEQAFQDIYDAMNQGLLYARFFMHNTEPEKPIQDAVYLADGTNWDPGSGRGLYLRRRNDTWLLIS